MSNDAIINRIVEIPEELQHILYTDKLSRLGGRLFLQIAFGFSGDLGAVFPELTKIVGRYMVDVQACADGYSMSAGYA